MVVFPDLLIGRVQKDVVETCAFTLELFYSVDHRAGHHVKPALDFQTFEVASDKLRSSAMMFDENRFTRATAESLDAYRARAGVCNEERRTRDRRGQHYKKCLAKLVRSGPQ